MLSFPNLAVRPSMAFVRVDCLKSDLRLSRSSLWDCVGTCADTVVPAPDEQLDSAPERLEAI